MYKLFYSPDLLVYEAIQFIPQNICNSKYDQDYSMNTNMLGDSLLGKIHFNNDFTTFQDE